jgi:acyl-CoA reductase-like NAD-dependent aldehyde dehydrogenase
VETRLLIDYTRDLRTTVRCMREIKAGTVWINDLAGA